MTSNSQKDYKAEFPLFQNRSIVYLDNAATAQRPQCVLDAMRNSTASTTQTLCAAFIL